MTVSRETAEWLDAGTLGGYVPRSCWPQSAEVHVRAGTDGSVWVYALALGGADPWHARQWARLRTREGEPLRVHALRVADGNAGVRLGQALTTASVGDGVPCRLWVRGVLVEEWTAQDCADLAPGLEVY